MTTTLRLSDNKNSQLVHVMYNEPNIPEISEYPAYSGKLKKILQINLTNATKNPFMHADKFYQGGVEDSLERAIGLGFRYAVIWFDGSWPKACEFDDRLLEQIEVWNKTRWLAAGHIISRPDRQPEWHRQCVVINLHTYNEIGVNQLDNYTGVVKVFSQSSQYIHDDYTPLWINGNDVLAHEMQTIIERDVDYQQTDNPLDMLFPHAIKNNCYIYNLPYSIRDEKTCCYPEDDIDFTQEWLFDYDFNLRHSVADAREFGYSQVSEDKRELFQYKIMDSHIVYVTNTESVPVYKNLGAEVMVVPCSGLHQFKYMSNNIDTLKRVVWTDFSKFGLAWVQKVLSDWDGLNFQKFYHDNRHIIMDMGFPDEDFIIFDPELVDDFIDSYETLEQWLGYWNRIKTLSHEFIEVDVVKEWPRVVNVVGKNNCVFVQFSNIWQYEINYINTPNFTAEVAFGNLLNQLLINNDTVYFTGDTPNGLHLQYQDLRFLPRII
jgi:hypothetical protein